MKRCGDFVVIPSKAGIQFKSNVKMNARLRHSGMTSKKSKKLKKREREKNIMKQFVGLFLAVAVLLMLSSCATWKPDTVAGYESAGAVLTDIETRAKGMCDSGKIKPDECGRLKRAYEKARAAYITSGDALILAMDAGDAATKQRSLAAYQKAVTDLGALLPELITTAGEVGIKTGH